MIELFATERDIPLRGWGSTTFKREGKERGLEPDECYCLGHDLGDAPDIALEVVVTSGGIDRLEVYRGLGVREVWVFRDARFRLFVLEGEQYREIARSALVPELDFSAMAALVAIPDQHTAVKSFRDQLRGGRRPGWGRRQRAGPCYGAAR